MAVRTRVQTATVYLSLDIGAYIHTFTLVLLSKNARKNRFRACFVVQGEACLACSAIKATLGGCLVVH